MEPAARAAGWEHLFDIPDGSIVIGKTHLPGPRMPGCGLLPGFCICYRLHTAVICSSSSTQRLTRLSPQALSFTFDIAHITDGSPVC